MKTLNFFTKNRPLIHIWDERSVNFAVPPDFRSHDLHSIAANGGHRRYLGNAFIGKQLRGFTRIQVWLSPTASSLYLDRLATSRNDICNHYSIFMSFVKRIQ